MTAMCMPRSRSSFGLWFLLICGIALAIILASTQAVVRHGESAMTAQRCFQGEGQTMRQVYVDPLTGRQMSFCNQQGHWFVSIDGPDGGNVTMFPRSFARCLTDLVEYAQRSGFTRMMFLH